MSIASIHGQFLWPRVMPAPAGIQERRARGLDARSSLPSTLIGGGRDVFLVLD
jgi:hypothetical protein